MQATAKALVKGKKELHVQSSILQKNDDITHCRFAKQLGQGKVHGSAYASACQSMLVRLKRNFTVCRIAL